MHPRVATMPSHVPAEGFDQVPVDPDFRIVVDCLHFRGLQAMLFSMDGGSNRRAVTRDCTHGTVLCAVKCSTLKEALAIITAGRLCDL